MEDSQTVKSGIGKDANEGASEAIRTGAQEGAGDAVAGPGAIQGGVKTDCRNPSNRCRAHGIITIILPLYLWS